MQKVTGIGGLFFRAHDPKALARWYQEHLGISLTPSSFEIHYGSKRPAPPFSALSRRRPTISATPKKSGW